MGRPRPRTAAARRRPPAQALWPGGGHRPPAGPARTPGRRPAAPGLARVHPGRRAAGADRRGWIRPRRTVPALGHRPAGAGRTGRAAGARCRPVGVLRPALGHRAGGGPRGALGRRMHQRGGRPDGDDRAAGSAPGGGRGRGDGGTGSGHRSGADLAAARILPGQARGAGAAPSPLRRHLRQPGTGHQGRTRWPARPAHPGLDGAARVRGERPGGPGQPGPPGAGRGGRPGARAPLAGAAALGPAPGRRAYGGAAALRLPEVAGPAAGFRGRRAQPGRREDDAGLLPQRRDRAPDQRPPAAALRGGIRWRGGGRAAGG